jgi:hypothetical protein
VVKLIARTTTQAGLRVRAELDRRNYPTGVTVTDTQLGAVHIQADDFHGDWNYAILPTRKKK